VARVKDRLTGRPDHRIADPQERTKAVRTWRPSLSDFAAWGRTSQGLPRRGREALGAPACGGARGIAAGRNPDCCGCAEAAVRVPGDPRPRGDPRHLQGPATVRLFAGDQGRASTEVGSSAPRRPAGRLPRRRLRPPPCLSHASIALARPPPSYPGPPLPSCPCFAFSCLCHGVPLLRPPRLAGGSCPGGASACSRSPGGCVSTSSQVTFYQHVGPLHPRCRPRRVPRPYRMQVHPSVPAPVRNDRSHPGFTHLLLPPSASSSRYHSMVSAVRKSQLPGRVSDEGFTPVLERPELWTPAALGGRTKADRLRRHGEGPARGLLRYSVVEKRPIMFRRLKLAPKLIGGFVLVPLSGTVHRDGRITSVSQLQRQVTVSPGEDVPGVNHLAGHAASVSTGRWRLRGRW